jgi:hypothetical protein
MMIQNAPPGQQRFISTMAEHNELCGQFARAFGNDRFERPEPFELMLFVIGHHDWGWKTWDARPAFDPAAGVPCGLGAARQPGSFATIAASPDVNETYHPYCGLLSSMHSWGLSNDRYGFSRFRARPGGGTSRPVTTGMADKTDALLASELARQERLRAQLAADPATRGWVEEKHLFQNYKQLQFFDTLALYFNLRHDSERCEEVYVHVPMTAEEDTNITVRPEGNGTYNFTPFPFAGERLEVINHGRWFMPLPAGEEPGDLATLLYGRPAARQRYIFVPG